MQLIEAYLARSEISEELRTQTPSISVDNDSLLTFNFAASIRVVMLRSDCINRFLFIRFGFSNFGRLPSAGFE